MRVGVGCSVLAKGFASGHIDGIGVYTRQILSSYVTVKPPEKIIPVLQGQSLNLTWQKAPVAASIGSPAIYFPYSHPVGSLLPAIFGFAYPGSSAIEKSIDLYHATDHQIPCFRRIPVVATIMDVIRLRHPEWVNPRLRSSKIWIFRRTLHWAKKIITISEFSAQDIQSCTGIPSKNIEVIPLGVDPSFFLKLEKEEKQQILSHYGLQPQFFLFVGTLQPRKNLERLLAAHRKLPKEMQRAYPLVVVGANGWLTGGLIEELKVAQQTGTVKWVQFAPKRHLLALLQSARALTYPSLYEGFGLPILEGFASGVPVLSSNNTSIPEVAGKAALLVNPYSINEISEGMRLLAESDAICQQLIAEGARQVSKFSWQETARKTLAVYRKVV